MTGETAGYADRHVLYAVQLTEKEREVCSMTGELLCLAGCPVYCRSRQCLYKELFVPGDIRMEAPSAACTDGRTCIRRDQLASVQLYASCLAAACGLPASAGRFAAGCAGDGSGALQLLNTAAGLEHAGKRYRSWLLDVLSFARRRKDSGLVFLAESAMAFGTAEGTMRMHRNEIIRAVQKSLQGGQA